MPHRIEELLEIMERLRDPEAGCPWDLEQDFSSIAPYTIEEAYEVADAIAQGEMQELKKELGDLLFQVVFHAQMARERGAFDFGDVVDAITEKMLRRHPHVFGDAVAGDEASLKAAWEAEKQRERRAQARHSALDGVARALPALVRADKLQKRAARVGFDWPDAGGAMAKVEEELEEVREAVEGGDAGRIAEEVGDLLFAAVNVARLLGVDAEQALRMGNDRFERRFRLMEEQLQRRGLELERLDPATLDRAWEEAKSAAREDG